VAPCVLSGDDELPVIEADEISQPVCSGPGADHREEVAARMGSWSGSIEPQGPDRCLLQLGGRSVDDIAFWLGVLEADFEVVDSPELAAAVRRIASRYARATA